MPMARIITADVLDGLRSLDNESVQCCISSPPYWGLRDYGTATWEGGDPSCDHKNDSAHQKQGVTSARSGRANVEQQRNENFRDACPKCGARRVDDQLGLEKTPEEYVEKLVAVFREVRRVLRTDGVCFLNLGDSYAGGGRAGKNGVQKWGGIESGNQDRKYGAPTEVPVGLKPKDLVGIPWRVAFALQADGWWLRSDVVEEVELYCPCGCGYILEERIWRHSQDRDIAWKKPNPMPESVTDRPTKSHEYIFILTKSDRYFWDQDAVREDGAEPERERNERVGGSTGHTVRHSPGGMIGVSTKRNIRSVWTIATAPFPGEFCISCKRFYADGGRHLAVHRAEETEKETKICACGRWDSWISHFACFPQTLVEPMIKAGSSEKGCCPECGAPRERVVERKAAERDDSGRTHSLPEQRMGKTPPPEKGWESERRTIGFRSTCDCEAGDPVPCTVLDPFAGAGTTGLVALKLGRDFVGVELNPDYAEMARKRIYQDAPLFNEVELSNRS